MDEGHHLLGLVRAIDRSARRHVYAVGVRPQAEIAGELGSLAAEGGEVHTPVWLTPEGRLMCETAAPPRRPSPGAAVRWIAEPARWTGDGPAVKARAVAKRVQLALQSLAGRAPRHAPTGEPSAWLFPEGASTVPLFEAAHPITGDQLLTTDPAEPGRLGYGGGRVLGHLVAAAPVTGVLGVPEIDLAWAARRSGARAGAPAVGHGAIEQPRVDRTASREAFMVRGMAMFPPGPVARVEIALDGKPAGCARLGLPRPDLAAEYLAAPEAPTCGFEFPVIAPLLDSESTEVRIDAMAVCADGRRFPLPGRTVALEAPRPGVGDARVAGPPKRAAGLIESTGAPAGESLNVLAFAHRVDLGGAQRYLFELLKRLTANPGFSCVVVAQGPGPYATLIEELGIPVHRSPGAGADDPEGYEGQMLELAAWAAPQGFDLIWANAFDSYQGIDLANRLQLPSVWSLHESFDPAHWWMVKYGTEGAFPYARERAERSLREAGALVFAADATARLYERHAPAQRALTLPYGLELDAIEQQSRGLDRASARAQLEIEEGTTVVLTIGTFEPRKGQALIARAFAAVAGDHPDATLVLVGDQAGEYSEGLHEQVRRTGLGDRIRIEPLAADPYAWHAIADLFVLASDIESSPIVVLEAMAFGTPTLATAVFGVPELIQDGVNGYLCEPSDLTSLAGGLERALSDCAQSRRRVGEAGRRTVSERHDPVRYEQRFRALMGELVSESRQPSSPIRAATTTSVSVVIPTLNAGNAFERSLQALRAQEGLGGLEILVADSGSSDDTVAVARRADAQVQALERSEFNHGAVRNLLADRARGDVLVMTVQDATVTSPTAVAELVGMLAENEWLAAVSATQETGPGADLFSCWEAWLRPQGPGEGSNVDNVFAAFRRAAWDQLGFRPLEFGEDHDFDLRAREAGWATAWSPQALVAHHHDRPAGHAFARSAIHRFQRGRLESDLRRHPAAEPGLQPLLAAMPTVLGELQAGLARAAPAGTQLTLARSLGRLQEALRGGPAFVAPEGELALLCELCPVDGPTEGAIPALREELLGAFDFPWLTQFALTQPEPVEARKSAEFVARFAGATLGQVVGDAMRDEPDSELAQRLRAAALRPSDEWTPS